MRYLSHLCSCILSFNDFQLINLVAQLVLILSINKAKKDKQRD